MTNETGLSRLKGNAPKPALRVWQGISLVD